jgi:hypothetical protein
MRRSKPPHCARLAESTPAFVRRALHRSAGVIATSIATLAPAASAEAFPPLFPLRGLYTGDGSEGIVLRGVLPRQFDRNSVSTAGDINADGTDDVILGAVDGVSYVVFGTPSGLPPVLSLASLAPPNGDGSTGFLLQQDTNSPASVSDAGDVNGDGVDDFAIGFRYAESARGLTYVVFGRDAGSGGSFPPVFPLGSLEPGGGGDGSEGFTIEGGENAHAGKSVSAAGDVNGDGIDDLILGGPNRSFAFCYYCAVRGDGYIVFGRDTQRDGNFPAKFLLSSLLAQNGGDGSTGVHLHGPDLNDYAGDAVAGGGDLNGDGIDDVVVGAWFAPQIVANRYAGQTFVVFGRDVAQSGSFPPEVSLEDFLPNNGGDGSDGFAITGVGGYDRTGYSVSFAGDVDGDGIDDMLIGALDVEESYVVFGRDTAQQGNFPAELRLAGLLPPVGDGTLGFVMRGSASLSRAAVSGAGDLNGDGIADLLVGAKDVPVGPVRAGVTFAVFGRDTAPTGNFPALLPLRSLAPPLGDGSTGFWMAGATDDSDTGIAVRDAGDFNADGIDDALIASKRDAYVVFGRDYDAEARRHGSPAPR